MRLSEYTDYTLRVLMYCAAHRDRLVTIGELAEQHGLSRNHLMKVVNDLAHRGLLETTRGRGGRVGRAARAGPGRRAQSRVVMTSVETVASITSCASRIMAPSSPATAAESTSSSARFDMDARSRSGNTRGSTRTAWSSARAACTATRATR